MTRNTLQDTARETLAAALRDADVSERAAGVEMGHSTMYARRRLTGEVPMTLDDLEALAAVAGLEVHVELVPTGGAV